MWVPGDREPRGWLTTRITSTNANYHKNLQSLSHNKNQRQQSPWTSLPVRKYVYRKTFSRNDNSRVQISSRAPFAYPVCPWRYCRSILVRKLWWSCPLRFHHASPYLRYLSYLTSLPVYWLEICFRSLRWWSIKHALASCLRLGPFYILHLSHSYGQLILRYAIPGTVKTSARFSGSVQRSTLVLMVVGMFR